MAGFRTHITVSTLCGLGYGAAAVKPLGFPAETAFLAAGITAVGGMLPDLDSDSGVPVRELSGLAAACSGHGSLEGCPIIHRVLGTAAEPSA